MNLYTLHDHPESIHGHDKKDSRVPELIWAKYKKDPASMKKYESVLAKDSHYAYLYAANILRHKWLKGEPAIAKDATCSWEYVMHVLKKPFPKGEKAILGSSFADAYRLNLEIYKDKE